MKVELDILLPALKYFSLKRLRIWNTSFFKVTLLFWLLEEMPHYLQRESNMRSAHFIILYFPVNELKMLLKHTFIV